MKTLFLLLLAVTLIAAGLLIFIGETSNELFTTFDTINGEPTLEIRP